jgi:hypothetical protein
MTDKDVIVVGGYRGGKPALYFFYFLTAFTLVRSLIHIVAPDGGAQSIATIPLDAYAAQGSPGAAAAVVHLFSLWGISQLLIGLVFLYACLRDRGLIPLCYLLAVLEYSLRLCMAFLKPMETVGTAPGAVGNWILPPLLFLLLLNSLEKKSKTGLEARKKT